MFRQFISVDEKNKTQTSKNLVKKKIVRLWFHCLRTFGCGQTGLIGAYHMTEHHHTTYQSKYVCFFFCLFIA